MKYLEELQTRFGQRIRDKVVSDIAHNREIGPNDLRTITKIISVVIIAIPYAIFWWGFGIITVNFWSLPATVLGLLLMATGYYLRTPAPKNERTTLRRADAPIMFALFDQISDTLDAPLIDGLHVVPEINAYMAEFGKSQYILGIGAPLWLALSPAERLSLLAHEIAHLINRDPARGILSLRALETLNRWHDLSHPPALIDHDTRTRYYMDDRGIIDQAFGIIFGGLIRVTMFGFERLIFADSQRAEYLADIAATSVAGVQAGLSTLKKLILAPLAFQVYDTIYFDGRKHVPLFQKMADSITRANVQEAQALFAEEMDRDLSIDNTHPPTRFRMEVIAAAGEVDPAIDADQINWAAIESELAASLSRVEQRALSEIIRQ